MKKRAISSVFYVIIIAGLIALRTVLLVPFDAFVMFLCAVGVFELYRAYSEKISYVHFLILEAGVFSGYVLYVFLGGMIAFCYALLLIFIALGISTFFVYEKKQESLRKSAMIVFYPIAVFFLLIDINHWGAAATTALLLIFVISPFEDTSAYLFGSLIKGPKLCPKISPNKTISGAIGGVVGGIVGSVIIYFIMQPHLNYQGSFPLVLIFMGAGLFGSIVSITGDLFESMLKRKMNIKDLGNLIPGHGGVMDRFDSTIFIVLFVYVYLSLIPLV